ncbi:metal ABC transporter solute-binding protein, Zn/Mn family [Desulfosediminicola flagellatus]|uniref:metal ABC transporter solute-binding protein, Zn/Mn family n=1 Tax=Desulfosediminicola flagellatus TaxID=2569541 RepID=UPI00142F0552|nr:zinc ABC transporter substrate-binding protein [Desulfosediminicola flagellatus]
MKKILLLLLISLCFLAGSSSYAAVEVFVSIPPQKWLVDKVGGEQVTSRVLVGEGQDPHTFSPTPRQMAALSRAKIWFIMEMEFEEQLVKKVKQVAPDLQIIDIAHHVQKISAVEDEHGEEHHGHDDHNDHEAKDPHVWLSPPNLMIMAEEISETLAQVDTANRSVYSANLADVKAELLLLHKENSKKLAPYSGNSFYVFHPSFGYFASAYGLKQEAVETGGKSPGPRQLSKLIAQARAEKVKVIFVQPQFDPKSARAVAAAIGGEVVPLNALAADVAGNLKIMATKIEAALAK